MPSTAVPHAPKFPVRAGRFFFKFRDLLFPLVFLPLALVTRPRPLTGHLDASLLLTILGLVVVIAGQSLRALVIGLAYIRRGGMNRAIHADALVVEGIFGHSRNPLYLGNLAIVLGLALMHGGTWMLLVAPPFFLAAYLSIVAAEESYLYERFGPEYAQYCAGVPRFFPRLRGLRATVGGMTFDWRRLLNKEYGTFFSTFSAVLLLLGWKRASTVGLQEAQPFILPLAWIWLAGLVAYSIARVMKKRHLLESPSRSGRSQAST